MTDEEIREIRNLPTVSYTLRKIADECLARGRRIAELAECRRLLEKLVNNHCHDLGCAISRDYAPPNAECTCGLQEAQVLLAKQTPRPL